MFSTHILSAISAIPVEYGAAWLALALFLHGIAMAKAASACGGGAFPACVPVFGHLALPRGLGYPAWPGIAVCTAYAVPFFLPAADIHQSVALALVLGGGYHSWLWAGPLSDGRRAGSGVTLGAVCGCLWFALAVLAGKGLGISGALAASAAFFTVTGAITFLFPLGKSPEFRPAIEDSADFPARTRKA